MCFRPYFYLFCFIFFLLGFSSENSFQLQKYYLITPLQLYLVKIYFYIRKLIYNFAIVLSLFSLFSMKHKGCISDFSARRNHELLSAFRKVIDSMDFIDINVAAEKVVNLPCSRFWISEERATAVISAIIRGQPITKSMHPTKREMINEIYSRVMAVRENNPQQNLCDIVFNIVNSPAPKFYMTPRYAINIIYKMKKKNHYKS